MVHLLQQDVVDLAALFGETKARRGQMFTRLLPDAIVPYRVSTTQASGVKPSQTRSPALTG